MDPEELVDMGNFIVEHNPASLVALGLGSCVAVALYDGEVRIGGLAHVMLPTSAECKRENTEGFNLNKFADVAIPSMLKEMERRGCKVERIKAKIVGGAHMFKNIVDLEILDIGKRNIEAVRQELNKFTIQIIAAEVGGSTGRTVHFDLKTGIIQIRTMNGIKEI